MKVFDRKVVPKKHDDGSYTLSVAVNDSSVVVISVEKNDLDRLVVDIHNLED